jgi:hypothetical protein
VELTFTKASSYIHKSGSEATNWQDQTGEETNDEKSEVKEVPQREVDRIQQKNANAISDLTATRKSRHSPMWSAHGRISRIFTMK